MTTDDNEKLDEESKSTLLLKNITVLGKRTSIRLEPEMWQELKNIAKREKCTIHDLCSLISLRKNPNTSLTAAIRVFLMLYFRAAATEEGHDKAGHGSFEYMKRRAGVATAWSALKFRRALEQDDAIKDRLSHHLSDNMQQTLRSL
jgi:predicted DNA-binding ribbon-helix-helix protein